MNPSSTHTHVVCAHGLDKRYGDVHAVRGIDFAVRERECFGFLGPNGAGKTTTMRMIYRATPVGGGSLRILGHEVGRGDNDRAIKRRLGVVPQEYNLDIRLSARRNLAVFARFYGLYGAAAAARVDELLEFIDLADRGDTPVDDLSGGLKRRVQIARGLLGKPDILVLDEPTTGLDPAVRNTLWQQLVALKRTGTTLVLTTHYMDEAEKLCDRLVIMDHGEIVGFGTPAELIARHLPAFVVELRAGPGDGDDADADADAELEALGQRFADATRRTARLADRLLLYTDDGEGLIQAVIAARPGVVATLRPANLEDVFLAITGRGLERA